MKRLVLLAFLTMILPTSALAADWPQWRGPEGSGVSPDEGLPVQWSEQSNLVWKAELQGSGVSSPIVWQDLVIVTSQVGRGSVRPGNHPSLSQGSDQLLTKAASSDDGKVYFLVEAFSRIDGQRRWTYRMEAGPELPPVHNKNNLATPSPVTDGERIYAWFGTGQLVALSMDGKEVWQRHLAKEYSPFEISWGHASSPTLYKDLVILLCDHEPASYLLALDKRTGEERWKADRGKGLRSYSTPFVARAKSGDELIVNSSERLDAYDPATGKPLWHTGGPNRFPVPAPSFHEGVIYTSRGYRSGPYMAIRTGGRGDISESHIQWLTPTGAPYVSSLVHYQGIVYMATDSGIAKAIDAANGETLWQERIGGVFSASPVAGDGKVYLLSEEGETVVLRAGRKAEVISRNRLPDRGIASPAIAGGQLFFRGDRFLFCVGEP